VVLPGGRKLALGCRDGSIRLRGPDEDETVAMHAHPTEVISIDVTLDGATLASLSYKDIQLWRLPELRPIGTAFGSAGVLSVKLSEDSKYLAGFTGAGDMLIWNLSSGEHSALWHTFAVMRNLSAAAFSPDSLCVAAVAGGDMGFIWNRTTQTRTSLPRVLAEYTSLSYSPDGTRLAAGSMGEAGIFDSTTGETVLALNQRGLKLAFLPDGERLLAVSSQGAKVLEAPPLKSFQSVGWLREQPSLEPPEYVGPRPAGVLFAEPRRK
jgi:WD40 repeat protein